jgi:hypothetical protein
MSRVTAAFVCALCDPDNPRPASIMCSNNCGRYVCAVHAVPRKGPGSAMVCQACAEALGLIDRPKPKPAPVPDVRPLLEIPSEPEPAPAKSAPVTAAAAAALAPESDAFQVEPFPAPTPADQSFKVEPFAAAVAKEAEPEVKSSAEQDTIVTPPVTPLPAKEAVVIDGTPSYEPRPTVRVSDTEPAPKSAASETIVSQRGNTLQVPKVSPTLGKPPQPIAPKPRKAQRSGEGGGGLDWQMIAMVAGTIGLGIVGFVMILAALAG